MRVCHVKLQGVERVTSKCSNSFGQHYSWSSLCPKQPASVIRKVDFRVRVVMSSLNKDTAIGGRQSPTPPQQISDSNLTVADYNLQPC